MAKPKTTAAPKSDQSISRAGFADDVEAKKCHSAFKILPSKIRANHYEDNHNRAAIYSLASELPELAKHPAFADDRFCFTRAEVLERVESFAAKGQQEPVKVYRSNTHQADLAAGFLRHAAGVFMEATGRLADTSMRDGLRCDAEERPKDPMAEVAKNLAENESKRVTPIDLAWACRRYKMLGKTPAEIGQLLSPKLAARGVDRYLQLLTLSPQKQLDVHEGRVSYSRALDEQSQAGRGTAKGERPGVKHTQLRRALLNTAKRPLPSKGLSANDTAILLGLIAGTAEVDDYDDLPELVADWYRAITPTGEEIKALAEPKPEAESKKRKKAPIKPGVSDEAGAA